MNRTKLGLIFWGASALLIAGIYANLPSVDAQQYPNTITLDNQSGESALVKLIGPTAQTVEVPDGQSRTVNGAKGTYYILVRYGGESDKYRYVRGKPFNVTQTATQYSKITITLHKVIGGKYATHPISAVEFEKPNLFVKNADPGEGEKTLSTIQKGMPSLQSFDILTGAMEIVGPPKTNDKEEVLKAQDVTLGSVTISFDVSKDRRSIREIIISMKNVKWKIKTQGETISLSSESRTNRLKGPFTIKSGRFDVSSGSIVNGQFISSTEARGAIHLVLPEYVQGKVLNLDWGMWSWKAKAEGKQLLSSTAREGIVVEDARIRINFDKVERTDTYPTEWRVAGYRYLPPKKGHHFIVIHVTILRIKDVHVVGFGGRRDETSILYDAKEQRYKLISGSARGWSYINPKKGLKSPSELVQGAKGILVFMIPEDEQLARLSFIYFYKKDWEEKTETRGQIDMKLPTHLTSTD